MWHAGTFHSLITRMCIRRAEGCALQCFSFVAVSGGVALVRSGSEGEGKRERKDEEGEAGR